MKGAGKTGGKRGILELPMSGLSYCSFILSPILPCTKVLQFLLCMLFTIIQTHFYKSTEFSKSTAIAQGKNMGQNYENTNPPKQKVSTFKKLITKYVMTTSFSYILIIFHEYCHLKTANYDIIISHKEQVRPLTNQINNLVHYQIGSDSNLCHR